jgi:uncharacterized protein (DUF1778 family)
MKLRPTNLGNIHSGYVQNLALLAKLAYIEVQEIAMQQDINKSERLQARIAPEALAVVKRAAELEGRSVSDFVVAAAHAAAQRAIEDAQIIRLSVEDQRRFAEAIIDPPPPNEALRRAAQAHHRLVAPLDR